MRVMAIAGVLLLGLGGCAKSEPGAKAGGAAATAAAPATPPVVHFTARDFAFQGPDTISSGMTTIVLHNDGPSLHHLMLVRLDSSKTVEDLKAAYKALAPGLDMPPAWAVPSGGVNPPMPGSDTQATLMIEPGNYAVVCVVDVPDHVLHVDKGMIKGLTVVPSATPSAPAPTSDMTVTEVDFAFAPSGAFTAGHHVIKVVNNGTQPHEMEVIKLAPGKTMDDLGKWGQTFKGPLPGTSLGGASPMSPGQVEYVPFDFTAGNYAILCFVVDPASHMPHLAKGMVLPFTIS
ncbi:MAG: hypothetical protein LJF04_19365 [Gemmatimonadetes bacterium]|nr:hypothetical protein [Gemmatimonadota bacterium]